jgi:amino acid transporter
LQPFAWGSFNSGAVGISVLFAVTCFLGFEATAIFRDEVKRPRETIPRATYLAVLLIGLFYAVAAWMIVTAFGIDQVTAIAKADPPSMFPDAMRKFVGKGSVDVVHVLLMSSLFAAILSAQNILARYVFCLGSDGALPRILGSVHTRHHSPYVAAVVVSVIWFVMGLVFVFLHTDPALLYARVAGVGGFAVLVLMLLTSIAVVVFFRRSNHVKDSTPWHTVVAPAIAAVGLAIIVFLAVTNLAVLVGGSKTDAILLQILTWGVLFLGMVLAIVYRYKRPDVYYHIGHQSP